MQERDIELIKDESLSQKLIKKWFWLYFFGYLSAPLRYIIRVIISNSPDVSVAEFWVLYSIISLVTILYTYNDLWLTESLQYFLPRFYFRKQFDNIKTTIYVSLLAQILTGIIIALWLWFGSDWLAVNYFQSEVAGKILRYFCFYFFGMNILQVIQTIFKAFQKTFEFQFTGFIKVLSIFIFTISFFFLGKDNIEYYSLSRLFWIWIAIILALILYARYHKNIMQGIFQINNVVFKKYSKYALRSLIWSSISNLFWQIILQLVTYFLWTESAGYYSNFLSLFYIGNSILWPIMFLVFPLTSELIEKTKKEEIDCLLSAFYTYFSIIILSFSTLFIVWGPEIAIALFWKNFILSWKLLSIGWIFLIFNLLTSFNYAILAWLWKVEKRVLITGISCLVMFIIWYIGIKLGWLYWACIAFWIGNICNWTLSLLIIKMYGYKCNIDWKFVIKNCFLFLCLWIVIYLCKMLFLHGYTTSRINAIGYLVCIWLFFYWVLRLSNKKVIKKFIHKQ